MWTSLGADQGNERARTYLPAIEAAMTARELKRSKAKVAAFSPNSTPRRRQMTQRDVLRAIGVNRALIELDRFDGAGF